MVTVSRNRFTLQPYIRMVIVDPKQVVRRVIEEVIAGGGST
jgi:hypothetical protein